MMPVTRRDCLFAVLTLWPLGRQGNAHAFAPRPDRVGEIEWHIAFVTNQQRMWQNLALLAPSESLAGIARGHSQDMLTRGFFDHRTPEGTGSADRIARQGLSFTVSSENIYLMRNGTTDAAELASIMVGGWMKTKAHRRNMLDPAFLYLGVGVASSERLVIATQLFGG